MAEAHQILSQLPSEEIENLLTRVMAFALRRLGMRAGHSPEMHPEDLTHQALADTLAGRRQWNDAIHSLEQHLTATINSYISHYFSSLAAKSVSHSTDIDVKDAAQPSPEYILNKQELAHSIREAINTETDLLLRQTWHLFETEGWDLKKDSAHFCARLGLDGTSGSADYQRFNRVRNRIRHITRSCALDQMQRSAEVASA